MECKVKTTLAFKILQFDSFERSIILKLIMEMIVIILNACVYICIFNLFLFGLNHLYLMCLLYIWVIYET